MPLIQDYNKLFEYTDNIKKVILNGNIVWPTEKPVIGPDYTEPFYVENVTNTSETLSIVKANNGAPTLTIEYSTDKTNWDTLGTTSLTHLTKPLAPGEKIYLRCSTNVWNSNRILGVSKVGGNTMSLLYGSNFTGQETSFPNTEGNTFTQLFVSSNTLQDASNLLLPATTLTNSCYFRMFRKCASLISAPALPATTLTDYCYSSMFGSCTSLNEVTCLATSGINTNSSTSYWLSGVSSTGTFTKAAGATWPSGANGIPSGWTVVEV